MAWTHRSRFNSHLPILDRVHSPMKRAPRYRAGKSCCLSRIAIAWDGAPSSLLMAIQISRVIERSSIWMPSARDVTRASSLPSLPFLHEALLSLPPNHPPPSDTTRVLYVARFLVAQKFVVFLFPLNESIGSALHPPYTRASPTGSPLEALLQRNREERMEVAAIPLRGWDLQLTFLWLHLPVPTCAGTFEVSRVACARQIV